MHKKSYKSSYITNMKKKLKMIIKKHAKAMDKYLKIHNRWCEDGRNRIELCDRVTEIEKDRDLLQVIIKWEEGLEALRPWEIEAIKKGYKQGWDKLLTKII